MYVIDTYSVRLANKVSPRAICADVTIVPYMYSRPTISDEKAGEHDTTRKSFAEFVIPDNMPNPWTIFIHPEGARYYVNSLMNVVTDSNIGMREIFDKIVKGLGEFQSLVSNHLGNIPKSSELYIKLDDTEENQCDYYLVDHDTRTEFWLQPLTAADLGLQQTCSATHLSELPRPLSERIELN